MENKEKDYKEERFEFTIYVNDNIICKRNFRIYNFIENSMNTYEFKEALDDIVQLIDDDLKSKSRVYTWYFFNPKAPDENEDFNTPLIEPWECTFKIVISDNKRDIITRIWDGYAYPRYIRDRVDLSNKYVKVMNKDGLPFLYEKNKFFSENDGRLSYDHEVLKHMIIDKPDVLLQITKKICEACSPTKEEIKENGRFYTRDSWKYLNKYTVTDNYGKDKDGNEKKYSYSLYLANKKLEDDWERAVAEKTKKYFKNMY